MNQRACSASRRVSLSSIPARVAVTAALALGGGPAAAEGYDKPPRPLLDVLHAPSPPSPYVNPTATAVLLVSAVHYPPMARVAEPFLRLAGARVEPRNHSKHDTPGGYGITPCAESYTLAAIPSGAELRIALPAGGCAGEPTWSADGARFMFQNLAADAVELWIGDLTGRVQRVPGVRLNPMLENAARWMPDQKTLIVKLVPDGLGAPPPAPVTALGPSIQEASGEHGESSTYEVRDTLNDAHDEAVFDYYARSQLAIVDAAGFAIKRLGVPDRYAEVAPAPDGVHLLVDVIHRPYSYVTTLGRFAHDVVVWDLARNDRHVMASLPLADRVPVHGVPTGPRGFQWRSTAPATLVWAEALDGGDWNVKVAARDKVWIQQAPFTAPPVELARTEQRFAGMTWGAAPGTAFLHEDDLNRHWTRVFTLDVDDRQARPRLFWDFSSDEMYKHPGSLVMRQLASGAWVARQDGNTVYTSGAGFAPTGARPFLDRVDLQTRATERLFRSDPAVFERFLTFAAPAAPAPASASGSAGLALLTLHESPSEPPNVFVRTLGDRVASPAAGEPTVASSAAQVTHVADPTPIIRAIKKRIVRYKRKDGVDLSFTLYTPPDYQEGTRVPAILYAYPLDYADAKMAGQVGSSSQRFTRLAPYELLLLAGYAIINNASFPIVGDPKKAYDTYLEQLTADATAAVDKAVELGVVDRGRIGVTGHSHGALMTANLLAHTDLFRAGVATSGSYNKTLTPFGFQNERRSVWEAQNVYLKVSPFFFADKLKLPILIVHGADDANPGTTPLQANKLYEAIRGTGGTARLVVLPHEPHWYTAMESNEQLTAEMLRWFDRFVKHAGPREPAGHAPAARAAH
ncbi:MAG TPA: prolyl oligopeptidase family serine peptidase [Kofleriaceae bacterium]|nr:prolyl oligopeptidase family serine peptidase [Kofleriaceae bacterium]